jgi:hypothetical protein
LTCAVEQRAETIGNAETLRLDTVNHVAGCRSHLVEVGESEIALRLLHKRTAFQNPDGPRS